MLNNYRQNHIKSKKSNNFIPQINPLDNLVFELDFN